jgi:biotin synthase
MSEIQAILDRLPPSGRRIPSRRAVQALLQARDADLAALYARADAVRHESVGDAVHLRGIIEFSNRCRRNCDYCGIRGGNREATRYRMSPDEILAQVRRVAKLGVATVVLQSGEDPWFTADRLCDLLRAIKDNTGMAVTLSIGERPLEELMRFKAAGCDRYLLRFETSNRILFRRLHPDDDFDERMECLANIRKAGIQTGSGFMIGLPFADLGILAEDIRFAAHLELDMIGCGPFLSHPHTPLAGQPALEDREIYFKAIAILRLLCPYAHIPATTAFDALCPGGRDLVLTRGGNVFMPNLTPAKYRAHYLLYPNKPCVDEDGERCLGCVAARLARLKRPVARGRGDSLVAERRSR